MSFTKQLHESRLAAMKELLSLGELLYTKGSNAYAKFKSLVMDEFKGQGEQDNLILVGNKLAIPCDCGAGFDKGPRWTKCPDCGGCGFKPIGGDDGTLG